MAKIFRSPELGVKLSYISQNAIKKPEYLGYTPWELYCKFNSKTPEDEPYYKYRPLIKFSLSRNMGFKLPEASYDEANDDVRHYKFGPDNCWNDLAGPLKVEL